MSNYEDIEKKFSFDWQLQHLVEKAYWFYTKYVISLNLLYGDLEDLLNYETKNIKFSIKKTSGIPCVFLNDKEIVSKVKITAIQELRNEIEKLEKFLEEHKKLITPAKALKEICYKQDEIIEDYEENEKNYCNEKITQEEYKDKKKELEYSFMDLKIDLNYIIRENNIVWQTFDEWAKQDAKRTYKKGDSLK